MVPSVDAAVRAVGADPTVLAAAVLARGTAALEPRAAAAVVAARAAEATALVAAREATASLPPALAGAWGHAERVRSSRGLSSAGDGGGISREEEAYLSLRRRPLRPAARQRLRIAAAQGWHATWVPWAHLLAVPAGRRRALLGMLLPSRLRPRHDEGPRVR